MIFVSPRTSGEATDQQGADDDADDPFDLTN